MKAQVLTLLSLIFVLGCETETTPETQDSVIGDRLDVPTLLPLVDGECEEGVSNLAGIDYWTWTGEDLVRNSFRGGFWTAEQFLQSPAISRTVFGYQEINEVDESCDNLNSVSGLLQGGCLKERIVTQKPLNLKICDSYEYPRPSIEAAALSVAGILDSAYGFAMKNSGNKRLDPLALLVLPDIRFRKNIGNELSITDNAGWVLSEKFADIGIRNYLVFYPMSASYLSSGKPPFWEIPWVINHEYGHHLFFAYLGPLVKEAFGYFNMQSFDRTFHEHHKHLSDTSTGRGQSLFFTAINEAVADLFAHYSLGNSSIQMTSISCRFALRDVSTSTLNNGLPKRFNAGDATPSDASPCEEVDYGNVHTIGSIIAHFYDQTLLLSGIKDPEAKAQRMFSFLDVFSQRLEARLGSGLKISSSDLAEQLIAAAFEDLENSGKSIRGRHCELVDKVFGNNFDLRTTMVSKISQCL